MHDHSLGGFVDVGFVEDAEHRGECNDSVFGCTHCHDARAINGECSECDYCHAVAPTLITMAVEEPVSYKLCYKCVEKVNAELVALAKTITDSEGLEEDEDLDTLYVNDEDDEEQ